MAEYDDNNRSGKAREQTRLRATFGDEPGSGYAFHDEGRVERVRSSLPRRNSGSIAPAGIAPAGPRAEALVQHFDVPPPDPDDDAPDNSQVREKPSLPASLAQPVAALSALSPAQIPAPFPAPTSELPTVPLRSRPPPGEFHGAHHGRTSDARFARLEPLVARSAWDQVLVELTHERDLPPVLNLLRLIARREIDPAVDAKNRHIVATDATLAVASLLGVSPDSPVALVIAKRLLRQNPRGLRRQAPRPGVSGGIVLLGIAVGASIGWLFTHLFL